MRPPHPIPYQGSKRNLAGAILAIVEGRHVRRLYEPFAGSAAITIAAARAGLADEFIIGDTLVPLIDIWRRVLGDPTGLAEEYAQIWTGLRVADDEGTYYARVRDEFNRTGGAGRLLYLLARCVKNSPRWNRDGAFNQSADKRRLGMHPTKMRRELAGANHLLRGKTLAVACDFEKAVADADPLDLVYMDPPWEGTSGGRDTRYHQGLARERLIAVLDALNGRGVPWLLSYDGRCGNKSYGSPLPAELKAKRLELEAGRSSQATLNGVAAVTVESLYVSVSLASDTPRLPLGGAAAGVAVRARSAGGRARADHAPRRQAGAGRAAAVKRAPRDAFGGEGAVPRRRRPVADRSALARA